MLFRSGQFSHEYDRPDHDEQAPGSRNKWGDFNHKDGQGKTTNKAKVLLAEFGFQHQKDEGNVRATANQYLN